MNNGFNVLAIMDEYPDLLDFAAIHYGEWVANCKGAYIASPHVIESLEKARKARVAVAELIERAEDALHTLGYYAELLDSERGSGHSIEKLVTAGEEPEYVSLRAAISRVKGEEA